LIRQIFTVSTAPALCAHAETALANPTAPAVCRVRAQQLGVAMAWVPLVMVAMNVVYAASSYPFGKLSDRVGRRRLLAGGLLVLVLVLADLALASDSGWTGLGMGVAL